MPTTTLDLLNKALLTGGSERELSRTLRLASSTLSVGRHRGRLSPAAAGRVAAHMGLDPVPWIALAALEAEKSTPVLETLRKRITAQLRSFAHAVATLTTRRATARA